MKTTCNFPALFPASRRRLAVRLAALCFAGSLCQVSAQTLQLQFGFEDTGTTTTDSVHGVKLNLVNSSGAATDLHGAPGSGVAGVGAALDFSAAAAQGGAGPLAYATNNTAFQFGTITNFAITMWINPSSSLLVSGFPRFFSLGANTDTDRAVTNSLQLLSNGNDQTTTAVQGFVNTASTSTSAFGTYNMPAGQWSFMALVYDGSTLKFYGGTPTAAATLQTTATFAAGTVNLPAAWNVFLGNRLPGATQNRAFQGLLDDVRFYVGAASSNFIESVRASIVPPPAPSTLAAEGCNNQVTLSWSPAAGASGYVVMRAGASGAETNYATTTKTNYIDLNVVAGNTYYYEILATNAIGSSPASVEGSAPVTAGSNFTINSQPTNEITCSGSTATFTVGVSGSGLSYDWQQSYDGTNWNELGAPSSPAYTTWTTSDSDNNTYYRVVISGSCSSLASSAATLLVNDASFTSTPADQTVGVSWPAVFTVQVSGANAGLTYQWRKNGANLVNGPAVGGAQTATLTFSNVMLADSGSTIDCLVTNACGGMDSPAATLTVITNPLQMQFSFEDTGVTATDSVAGVTLQLVDATGAPADLHGAAGSGVGGIGQALDFSSAAAQGGAGPLASVQGCSAIDFGTVGSFTITLWINPSSTLLVAGFPRFFSLGVNGDADRNIADSLQFLSNGSDQSTTAIQGFVNTSQSSTAAFGAFNMPPNQWSFLALTYDGNTLSFYGGSETNAVALASSTNFPAGTLAISDSWSLFLGNRLDQTRAFQGLLDDVRFYLGAAPLSFLQGVQAASAISAPRNLNLAGCGGQATLTWTVSPAATGYLVHRSNTSGAETNYAATASNQFTDTQVVAGTKYFYTVSATNAVAVSAPSAEVNATIVSGPSFTILTQPTNQTVCLGATATFAVSVSGAVTAYDWQSSTNGADWIDTGAPSAPTYTTPALTDANNGTHYQVVLVGTCGSLVSSAATLTVLDPITFSLPPASQTVCVGWPVSFSVAASRTNVAYQWRENGINLTNNAAVSGATGATLLLSNPLLADSGAAFDCLVSDPLCGGALSPAATLTVRTNALLRFAFADSGTTTTDSISGVTLQLVDGTGAPADLHGAAGSGVGGIGQALDFSSATSQGGTGPLASVQGSSAIDFGTVEAFTITLWVNPSSTLLVSGGYPRFFSLGANGDTDRNVTNSLQFLSNGSLQSTTAIQGYVNTVQSSTSTFGAFTMPANQWSFLALTYDGSTLDFYGGSETNAVTLASSGSFPAGSMDIGDSWSLFLGNRLSQDRAFQGQMDDVRFYLGAAPASFLETVRDSVAPIMPASGTNLTYSISGNTLTLNWPANYIGWELQSNALDLSVSNDWQLVPGSTGTNRFNFTLLPGQTNVFFRMLHP